MMMMMCVQNVTSSLPFPLLLSVAVVKNPCCYNNSNNILLPEKPNLISCRSSGRHPGWGSGADGAQSFSFDDDDRGSRKRVWWSDDFEDDDDDDDHGVGVGLGLGFGGFGVLEDTSFIFKVLNAFGWMVPAIAISMLLGTGGTNTFLMALALPLAQSAVSFIADTFLGSSIGPKPKRKRAKKKPFYRAPNSTEMGQDVNTNEVNGSYQFREATKNEPCDKSASSFGGWDELDKGLGSYKVPKREPASNTNELRSENRSKLSRRARTRGTPLLVRLLIAVFPFLGSWTRLL